MERIVRQISQTYYLAYTATILSAIIGYLATYSMENVAIEPRSELGITLSSILYIYMLASIPAALALFNKNTKKWRLIEDKNEKMQAYKKGATLRLAIIGVSLVASIALFYVIKDVSMIYCFGISAIALFFCKPSVAKMANELDIEE